MFAKDNNLDQQTRRMKDTIDEATRKITEKDR
jgi:hypothetical protein